MWSVPIAAVVIAAAGLFAFASSFDGALVHDDEPAIAQNTFLRQLWPLTSAMSAPPGTTLSSRPFASLTFALNYALAPESVREAFLPSADASPVRLDEIQRNLWGYHALNLAIHLCAALVLFGVVRRTFLTFPPGHAFARGATLLAACAAALWVAHPLTTAAVTYVVQRVESLMALCLLLTVYCGIRTWDGSWRWTAGAALACAAGMATKESMVVAPLTVLTWDAVFGGRNLTWRDLLAKRWRLYALLAASWLLLAALVAGSHRRDAAGFGFADWPWWQYLATQSGVIVHYLSLAIYPSPLVLDYDWPPATVGSVVVPVLALTIAVGASVVMLIRRQPAGFAGTTFFLLLAPTSSVLPIVTEIAAEHRMYLPLAVVVVTIVAGVYALAAGTRIARGFVAAVALVTVVFAAVTSARNAEYRSAEFLWLDTIAKRPANSRARHNHATMLLERGLFADAESQLRVALQHQPRFAEARAALGTALCAQGRLDEGIAELQAALAVAPANPAAEQSLGEAYASRGDMERAVVHYTRALVLRPDDVAVMNRVGWILATDPHDATRDGARALSLSTRAVELTGRRDITSLDTLAAAQAEQQRFAAAAATGAEALSLARASGAADYIPELEGRLRQYRERQPFRSRRP
jgi:tetratricopeptide (TPR) repeat protein